MNNLLRIQEAGGTSTDCVRQLTYEQALEKLNALNFANLVNQVGRNIVDLIESYQRTSPDESLSVTWIGARQFYPVMSDVALMINWPWQGSLTIDEVRPLIEALIEAVASCAEVVRYPGISEIVRELKNQEGEIQALMQSLKTQIALYQDQRRRGITH